MDVPLSIADQEQVNGYFTIPFSTGGIISTGQAEVQGDDAVSIDFEIITLDSEAITIT